MRTTVWEYCLISRSLRLPKIFLRKPVIIFSSFRNWLQSKLMPAQEGVMLKLKPVIIFSSIRNGRQRKLMPANAGVMLKLKPEIMGYTAANERGKTDPQF